MIFRMKNGKMENGKRKTENGKRLDIIC